MSVELIITQGSRAGSTAPIHSGYYLLGRNKDCQIRPKSRSVSRRHCLLLHNDDGFGALDLKSTGGTWVNQDKIEPHHWRVLHDGDLIRFGKVEFRVSIRQPVVANQDSGLSVEPPTDSASVAPPKSWQNFDVADFLEAEDEAEYQDRYGTSDKTSGDSKDEDEFAEDLSVFADTPLESKSHDTFVGEPSAEAEEDQEKSDADIEVDAAPKQRPPRRTPSPKEYKRASRKSLRMPSFSMSLDWKTMGAIALVVCTLGLATYQFQRLINGPSIEVRKNLD